MGGNGAPRLMIFDCDGVLVDSERISVRVGAALCTEHGWELTEEDFAARFVGCSAQFFGEQISRHLGPDLARDWGLRHADRYREAFEAELMAVHGVAELLSALAARGIRTCVASNSDHSHVERVLALAGLGRHLTGPVFSAHDVPAGKPAPDLFLHAARTLTTDPDQCIVVEDSPFGVMAARAAGMRCYGYAGGLTPAHRLRELGAVTFDDMTALAEVLDLDQYAAVP